MNVLGLMIQGCSREQWEALILLPDAASGEFDPQKAQGEVWFRSVHAAQAAFKEAV